MTIAAETPTWEIVSAVATAAAVLLALAIALASPTVRHWTRPKLKFVTGDQEPHTMPVAGPGFRIADQVVLRVEIQNEGKTTASRCWAQVDRRWRRDQVLDETKWPIGSPRPYRIEDWVLVEEDPLFLRWSSLPFAIDRGPGVPPWSMSRRGIRSSPSSPCSMPPRTV